MKIVAVSTADGVPIMGKKWAILDKRSTTTRIVVNSSEGGSSTIKSIEIFFHGCSGTGSGRNRPQDLTLGPLVSLAGHAGANIFPAI